jgi:hypothetical protein
MSRDEDATIYIHVLEREKEKLLACSGPQTKKGLYITCFTEDRDAMFIVIDNMERL